MTNEEYRAHEGVSRSDLFHMMKSPKDYKCYIENKQDKTKALAFGTAAHTMILEPDIFDLAYAVAPNVDKRTKAGKEEWQAFVEANEGKEVISTDDYATIFAMQEAVHEHPVADRLLANAKTEQSFFWTDEETGIPCKCRPDIITTWNGKPCLVDYKTTDSVADGHFERSCKKYGYKMQAGMYCEGTSMNTYEDYDFAFIAQEKTAPYAVRVYHCSREFIQEGVDQFRLCLGILKYCLETDNWYGYEDEDGEGYTELVGEGEK